MPLMSISKITKSEDKEFLMYYKNKINILFATICVLMFIHLLLIFVFKTYTTIELFCLERNFLVPVFKK